MQGSPLVAQPTLMVWHDQKHYLQAHNCPSFGAPPVNGPGIGPGWQQSKQNLIQSAVVGTQISLVHDDTCCQELTRLLRPLFFCSPLLPQHSTSPVCPRTLLSSLGPRLVQNYSNSFRDVNIASSRDRSVLRLDTARETLSTSTNCCLHWQNHSAEQLRERCSTYGTWETLFFLLQDDVGGGGMSGIDSSRATHVDGLH